MLYITCCEVPKLGSTVYWSLLLQQSLLVCSFHVWVLCFLLSLSHSFTLSLSHAHFLTLSNSNICKCRSKYKSRSRSNQYQCESVAVKVLILLKLCFSKFAEMKNYNIIKSKIRDIWIFFWYFLGFPFFQSLKPSSWFAFFPSLLVYILVLQMLLLLIHEDSVSFSVLHFWSKNSCWNSVLLYFKLLVAFQEQFFHSVSSSKSK